MRLKQVRLSGFKSFCDSSDLAFDANGVTMVVGPNGCGKSNVVDAVRWALGEQSPRLMRGAAMGDVIFSGSTSRKPVGRAEVTLVFDNARRSAMEKYNEFSEISVTRRLYRSGDSEYLINKLPCRLLDIRELVMDTGAAGRSYSIVEQGRVDEFVTASPQDRRAFMEEAAGIVRYKTRRIAAEKKLEQTRQNLLRVEDVLGELGRQEVALREQMEAAHEFRALQQEVALLKGDLARLRHAASARACEALEAQRGTALEEATALEQSLAARNAELERLALEQTRQETALRESRGALFGRERQLQQSETALALERQRLENTRAWTTQLRQTLDELRQAQAAATAQGESQRQEADALATETKRLGEEISAEEQAHGAQEASLSALTARLSALQERLLESHTQIAGTENQGRFLEERLRDDEQRRAALHARINAVSTELEQLRMAQEEHQARATELAQAHTNAEAEGATLAGELAEAERTRTVQRDRLRAAEREELECRSRLDSLAEIEAGYEGFAEHVRTLLDWLREHPDERDALGVLGPLADLVVVPAEVAVWSGDYLAPHLETVVIQSSAALPALTERVQALEAGGVRFLALDALPPVANGDAGAAALPALAGLLGHAGNGHAEAGARVTAALFGATHVLPEGAGPHPLPQPLGRGHEWLAPDGAFQVDGQACVTLGQAGSAGAGLLRRRGEMAALRVRLAEQEARRAQAQEEAQALAAQIEALSTRCREQERRAAELGLAQKAAQQDLAQGERERQRLEQVRGTVQREAAQFHEELERYRAQQAALGLELQRWQETRARLEGEAATLRGEVESARAALHGAGEALTERKVTLGRLTSRLEALRTRAAELERERTQAAAKLSETEAALAAQQGQEATGAEAIAALESEQKAHHAAIAELRGKERERRQAFESLAERHRVLAEQVRAGQRQHEAAQGRLHKLELELTAERMRLEQHTEALQGLPERPAPQEGEDIAPAAPPDERALEGRLATAQANLSRMQGVNLGAPEEYEALSTRLTFLSSQRDDLTRASDDLEGAIRRMNAESRRRFRETFDQVNEKFQVLFPQVFGGGEARLVLTDSDDPLVAGVDIEAQPPGKKLQNLSLLSGGEKAMTAIALIFSFFLHKPSPFCLLDEVDAPLDDVNVTRFKRLIQGMTEHSQFIIITHNKRTMEVADRLYGVTMEEAGVSKIVSVKLSGAA